MILDNQNENPKVYEILKRYNEEGLMDIVTGYFTVGALAYLSQVTKDKIQKYRFILGDIVNFDEKINALNLLNENLSFDNAFQLKQLADEAVCFLKLDNVAVKTLEPNFCHAKLYLKSAKQDERNHFFISGSSNLTEAGIGKKTTSNVELNIAETGDNAQFKELAKWFEELWEKPQAHTEKTLKDADGKSYKKDFKQYLIDEISKLFAIYTPEQIYFKILFELFNTKIDEEETNKQITRLEDTVVYNKLYDFQKMGVQNLIRMLNEYNGAILADAVGLGKTWSALAVIKSYEMRGFNVVLLCPKKLEQNWGQYLKRQDSIFEDDQLDYVIRFHTDLREGGLQSGQLNESFFTNDKPKLFVIDESHNLRNDKSNRYIYLVDEILKKSKGDVKILLLSATPINNSFKDVRNQFKLITKGDNAGFKENLDVQNIEHTFKQVQKEFNEWAIDPQPRLADFHNRIKDSAFFKLTDNLLVARTRKSINKHFDNQLVFPKHRKPENKFITPIHFGNVENFADLIENLDLNLSAYLPATYLLTLDERIEWAKKRKGRDVTKDEVQREHFLVKMMMILMLKRLESSWYSFKVTVERIYQHHTNALRKISEYETAKNNQTFSFDDIDIRKDVITEQDEEEIKILETTTFGKKNPIRLSDIDKKGTLDEFKRAIKKDEKNLKYILDNVLEFEKKIDKEKGMKTNDDKLQALIDEISKKQKQNNKKIVLFTAYKDTATYLFEQLKIRGFEHFAMVAGDENRIWNEEHALAKHESILERFAPFTKLFKEKKWSDFDYDTDKTVDENYHSWKEYALNIPKVQEKIENPLHLLIATDVLSEGQNLQDADLVINYDIHWNPVRVIQRVGRIDRIGSPNTEIGSINFWPARDIDGYINLKARVERRMAIMKFAGAETIHGFTDEFAEMAESQSLEDRQNAIMLRQMEQSLENLDAEESLGFDDFSFDNYRQMLQNKLKQNQNEYTNLPNGVFSGFVSPDTENFKKAIIALLGYPAQKKYDPNFNYLSHELIHIDEQGNILSANQKIILEYLSQYYKLERNVPACIDSGDENCIKKWTQALKNWVQNQQSTAPLDFLNTLNTQPKQSIQKLKNEGNLQEKFQEDNFDLITWLLIS